MKPDEKIRDRLVEAVNAIGGELDELSKKIHDCPELGLEEVNACRWHSELLKKYGFCVEGNYCDFPTGFRAAFDSGKPGLTVAFLAEYDALPGIGHGCGHNILGATSTGAGIALSRVISETGGRVLVIGTPAEETCGAKVRMSERGCFDDVSVALMAHPASQYLRSGTSLALVPLQFEFHGKTAHAAACPHEGLNALNAAVNTYNLINAMRESIYPTSRVHGVIIDGGKAANIIPDYAKMQYYIRSELKSYNELLVERVKNCARAGALAAGCTLDISIYEEIYDNQITNETLAETFYEALRDVSGIECETDKDGFGSSDMGQVSQVCPAIQPSFDITNHDLSVAGHSRELCEYTLSPYAREQMRNVAASLALAAARVMTEPELYAAIRREFNEIKT